MDYNLLTDEAILKDIAEQVEKIRILKHLKETEIQELSGISRKTLYNFRKGSSSLSLKNFVRLLRVLGELDRLHLLFQESDTYSPLEDAQKEIPKRVRDKQMNNKAFKWGDES